MKSLFKIKKYLRKLITGSVLMASFQMPTVKAQENYSQYVNPFIGTAGHGHTFPGAVQPFGMVQVSPDTRIDGSWDGCSAYHYSDTIVYGFSHTHLSGTGCSDWGDILIMPGAGIPSAKPSLYASSFSHKYEKASAGYYEVLLNKHKIKAQLTVTPRVGIHSYTFQKNQQAHFIIDLLHRDKTTAARLKMVDSVTVIGFRISEAWAKEQHVYFAMKFSKPIKKIDYLFQGQVIDQTKTSEIRPEGAFVYFASNENIQVKVAISAVSEKNALENLNTEAPHWDFEKYKANAKTAWDQQLSKIEITSSNINEKVKFYTALYHCFIHPSLYMDVNHEYRGRDNKIYTAYGFTNYTVFSLWDTYRALHPLFTILEQERSKDFISSFLAQYKASGRLPVWELSSNETDCMIGYHSVSVISDAWMKGLVIRDSMALYQAMKAASQYSGFGIPLYNQKEFLQVDDENESVSKSLEYAYDNWCISRVAAKLGMKEEEQAYIKKSMAYKNLFDKNNGFMRPRKNGNWLSPFYPNEINNHFTEGNSWQYSFYVPHDIQGLISLHGGDLKFEQKLDELFSTSSQTRGREQADVTGLIGQYAHGNEPSHHMAFLYNYIGKPQKTISLVKKISQQFYSNSQDGLIGNEDCGQMSAWYIFASLGFYPVCPGNNEYAMSEPLFEKIKINLEKGPSFVLLNPMVSNASIHHLEINGKQSLQSVIPHQLITKGGELKIVKNQNNLETSEYGSLPANRPMSLTNSNVYLPVPLILSNQQVFKEQLEISIDGMDAKQSICVYTSDGTEPSAGSTVYRGPFSIHSTCTIKAKLFSNQGISATTMARFYKLKYNYEISLSNPTNSQYSANGTESLVDGINGDLNWRKGDWLGIQEKNFECLVDLKEQKTIQHLALNCLQDSRSWIVFPKRLQFFISSEANPSQFELIGEITNSIGAEAMEVQIKKFELNLPKEIKGRYLKVIAHNAGKLPAWHLGAGGETFIFCDELEMN